MNCDTLLDVLGEVDDRFWVEAIESRAGSAVNLPKRRMHLLAAAVIAALLLVGCAAAYYWMDGTSFTGYLRPVYFDNRGEPLPVPDVERQELATLVGLADSPNNKALQEWYFYTEDYEVPVEYDNEGHPDVPENYKHTYYAWMPDMQKKLDSIAGKYDLKLLDTNVVAEYGQLSMALDMLGWAEVIKPESGGKLRNGSARIYPPCNVHLETSNLYLPIVPATVNVMGTIKFYHKDYMPQYGYWIGMDDDGEQWEYVNDDGTRIYLAYTTSVNPLGQQVTGGVMLAEQPEGYMMITLSILPEGTTSFAVDKGTMEQVADCFDFSLMPKSVDGSALQAELDAAVQEGRTLYDLPTPLRTAYGEYLLQMVRDFPERKTWDYGLRDVNGDGVSELLLAVDSEVLEVLCPDDSGVPAVAQMETFDIKYLIWQPVLQYRYDGDIPIVNKLLEVDGKIPNDRLPLAYAAEIEADENWHHYTHYRIMDANGDGVDDLLLSCGGEVYDSLNTYIDGVVWNLLCAEEFYLCEDGVLEYPCVFRRPNGGYMNGTRYFRLGEGVTYSIRDFAAYVVYDPVENLWYGGETEEYRNRNMNVITEAEAKGIMDRYPRIDQGMHPVEELLG